MPILRTQCHISWADPVCKIGYFAWKLSVYLVEKMMCWPEGSLLAIRGPSDNRHKSKESYATLKQQQWTPIFRTQRHLSWAHLGRNIGFFCLKIECLFGRKDNMLNIEQIEYSVIDFSSFLYISGRLGNTQTEMDAFPFRTQCHISWSDLVPKTGYFAWNLSVYLVEKMMYWH